jgi:hypothetical protein
VHKARMQQRLATSRSEHAGGCGGQPVNRAPCLRSCL